MGEKKLEQWYTLTCDNCGEPYGSKEGFPKPQLCSKCAYVCPQCGPDPNGDEVHTLTHHTLPPYSVEEAAQIVKSGGIPANKGEKLKACPLPWELIDDSQTDSKELNIRFWAVRAANGKNIFRLTGSPEMKEVGERIVEAVNRRTEDKGVVEIAREVLADSDESLGCISLACRNRLRTVLAELSKPTVPEKDIPIVVLPDEDEGEKDCPDGLCLAHKNSLCRIIASREAQLAETKKEFSKALSDYRRTIDLYKGEIAEKEKLYRDLASSNDDKVMQIYKAKKRIEELENPPRRILRCDICEKEIMPGYICRICVMKHDAPELMAVVEALRKAFQTISTWADAHSSSMVVGWEEGSSDYENLKTAIFEFDEKQKGVEHGKKKDG